jgi:hypothetical protein
VLSSYSQLEIYAHQVIRARLAEAANDALADQLPRSPSSSFLMAAMSPILRQSKSGRQYLATSLRDLAVRLDPSVGCEPSVVIARPQ